MSRPSADVTWGGGDREPGKGCGRSLARVVLLVVAVLLVVTGCSKPVDERSKSDWVELPDGREVLCVAWKSGYGGGLSCDWDNARDRS